MTRQRLIFLRINDIYNMIEKASKYMYCQRCMKPLSETGYETRVVKDSNGSLVAIGKKIMRVVVHIYCKCGAYIGTHFDAYSAYMGARQWGRT